MMRILITAAEQEELDCAEQSLRKIQQKRRLKTQIDFMLTGIGSTSTSYRLTQKIYTAKIEDAPYTLILNIGIAGSFCFKQFPIGSSAIIEKEFFGDLGFETLTGFQTLFDYKILNANTFPYIDGALCINATQQDFSKLLNPKTQEFINKYHKAIAVTVQTVSGNPDKVEQVYKQFHPQIESMEGAAFYYVCISEKIPSLELRSISNKVGERNRDKWDIPSALLSLSAACLTFLETLE